MKFFNDWSLVVAGIAVYFGWQWLQRRYPSLAPRVRQATNGGLGGATKPLAWLWVLCVLLTLADWYTPLEFTNGYLAAAAHWGIWVLIFFALRHWGWPQQWATKLWASTIVVGLLALVNSWMGILGVPGIIIILFGIEFFAPVQRWQTTYTYYQRGTTQLVDQRKNAPFGENKHRRVQQRQLLPGWRWVEQELPYRGEGNPPERPAGEGWQWVGLKPDEHRLDPATQSRQQIQQQLDQNRRWAEECAQDLRDQSVGAELPAATQRGANTLGMLVKGAVWRERACQDTAIHTIVATWEPAHRPGQHDLVIRAYPLSGGHGHSLHLALYGVTGPGTYYPGAYNPVTRTTNGSFVRLGSPRGSQLSRSQPPFRVTITHLDTVAHVVAGTFEGQVARSATATPWQVELGRFDVRYVPLPRYP